MGGQIRRFGPQAEIKYDAALRSMVEMGYGAVGFGPQDLRLPSERLINVAVNFAEDSNPFVAANVGLFTLDSEFVSRWKVIRVGGRRLGVTAVLGKRYRATLQNSDIA